MTEFVEFKQLQNGKLNESGIGVDAILNKPIVISAVRIEDRNDGKGQLAVLTTDFGVVKTSSKVLIEGVGKFIEPEIEKGKSVKTTIIKIRGKNGFSYYSFS